MAAAQRIGGISVSIVADTAKFMRGMKESRKQLQRFANGAKIAARVAGTVFVAGTIAAARSVEQLNRSMTRSLAIMGDVSKTMRGEMRDAAIEVARTTSFSATQAADAYYFLASAGLDAQKSLAALPKVAQFAQAGNFDLALATDLLTDAQSALGLSSKDAGKNLTEMTRLSDVLVKANTLANASVEQFSKALTTKAGASLRLLGKDVEEGVAVLAAYADQGLKAEEAGTAFSIVLRDMQTKALSNAAAFRRMNIAVFDAMGEMRPIADIISDIERRLFGMSDAQKKATLLTLGFSDKSVAYTQSLVGTSEKIREYEEALRSAGGTTKSVADASLTPLEKAMNKLRGAFTKLAEAMSPVVNRMASAADSVAEIMRGFSMIGIGDAPKGSERWWAWDDLGPRTMRSNQAASARAAFYASPRSDYERMRFELGQAYQNRDIEAALAQFGIVSPGLQKPKPSLAARARGLLTSGTGGVQAGVNVVGNLFGRLGFKTDQQKADSFTRAKSLLGQAFGAALNTSFGRNVRQFGGMAASGLLSARDAAVRGYAGLPLALGQKIAMDNKRGINSPRSLAFAESGSAASYRQQAAIRRQNEGMKLDKQRNTLLQEIRDGVKNQPQLAMAGAG